MNGVVQTGGSVAKICTLEELARIVASLKAAGRTVVHCHGVFDLLHIGHIRHFEEARQMGDALIVTLTPDRFVNKGPHRPAFTEQLRAEAVAALGVIDYVAINEWPNAVETLTLLKPDIYAKGPDYRVASHDATGGIALEEAAVRAAGGRLVCTTAVTFSASTLINRHLPTFPPEVMAYLNGLRAKYSAGDVIGYLERAATLRVLTIGEAIIDEYQYCEAIGKSSKEPIVAVKRLSTETFAGGILAVANHVANFSNHVGLVSFLGTDDAHDPFVRQSINPAIDARFLYRAGAPTIVKRRFVEQYFFTKMLEVYEIDDGALAAEDDAALCGTLNEILPSYDAVVVVDFGHGMLSPAAIELLSQKARFLAVNAQANAASIGYHTISRYRRADYVCLTESEMRMEARDRRGDLRSMITRVADTLGCPRLVVTRGKQGCLAFDRNGGFVEAPALAGQVVDRMGAGDAFLSLTALCAAQHAPLDILALIGNAAGAQAVNTVGHRRSIERLPLFRQIESLLK